MKKDDTVRNLESKFDRETLGVLLGIDVKDIEILQRCNYLSLLSKPLTIYK
jgi:hypothetical protein